MMNSLEIAELRTESLRRETHKLCYYLDAYVSVFSKNYSILEDLLRVLDLLQELYQQLDARHGPTSAQLKDALFQQIHLVRLRMYYADKLIDATEEYNSQVLKVPVF